MISERRDGGDEGVGDEAGGRIKFTGGNSDGEGGGGWRLERPDEGRIGVVGGNMVSTEGEEATSMEFAGDGDLSELILL